MIGFEYELTRQDLTEGRCWLEGFGMGRMSLSLTLSWKGLSRCHPVQPEPVV